MMRKYFWLLLVVMVMLLAGCSGNSGIAPRQESASGGTAAPSLKSLAETVDVAKVEAVLGDPDVIVLDVREQSEYDAGHIPGVRLIPLGQIPQRLAEIPTDKTVIVTCRSGNRSAQAASLLREKGYTNIHNMAGGIIAWEKAGYPVEK